MSEIALAARQQSAIRQDRMARILEATRVSIATHGLAGATFEQIAAQADVSRGLLHYHFGSKHRLLAEVARCATPTQSDWLLGPLAVAETPKKLAEALVSAIERATAEHPDLFMPILELACEAHRNPEVRDGLASAFERSRTEIATLVELKQSQGHIDPDLDPNALAAVFQTLAQGYALQLLCEHEDDRELTRDALTVAIQRVLAEPKSSA